MRSNAGRVFATDAAPPQAPQAYHAGAAHPGQVVVQRSIVVGVAVCAALGGFAFELWRGGALRAADSADAGTAVRVAEPPVSATLLPGSGHLVHMPAHIYARVGRWHDAVLANEAAVKADDTYLSMCGRITGGVYPLGYVPHNHHFLWFAASMAGSSAVARAAALETAKRTDLQELMRQPGFAACRTTG